MVPIRQRTGARTAEVWAEAPTRLQTAVSFGERTETLERTMEFEPVGAPPVQARVGHVVGGRYRLEELLARRANSQTWRAFDVLLARSVIVHLLAGDESNHALIATAKKASLTADFRVLRVLDVRSPAASDAPDDGSVGPYIVCEYAPGKLLEDLLSTGPLSTLEAAWVVREVADALTGMHDRGLSHQRLSPATVVITDTGNIKIAGFLLETEIAPGHQTIRDAQEADVEALGHLLDTLLVSRGSASPEHGAAATSVAATLEQIFDRIVNPSWRGRADRLRTAAQVSAALSRVLGTADAAHDLERRVHGGSHTVADGTRVDHLPKAYAEQAPVEAPARQPKPKRPIRWRRLLVPLVLIAIVGSVTAVGLRLNQSTDAPGDPAAAQVQAGAPAEQWPVLAAKDFDPEGNGEERPNQVNLAWDGDPATSWTTMNYFEGDIGNKSGVGLVFDLGEVRQVSRVELDLDGNGTSLEVRVPSADGVTTAPLGVDQWRPIGTADRTPAATSISLQQPVQTRYVLVYLTELPPAGAAFTGGIAEARFWS